MAIESGAMLGPYTVVGALGRGGMGTVVRARHRTEGVEVALKTLARVDRWRIAGLRREIRALSALSHPGLVALVDHGEADGLPWYAMELLPGATLASLLPRAHSQATTYSTLEAADGEPLVAPAASNAGPPREAIHRVLPLLRHLCDVLAYLHGEGVVHRDLKPANILLRADGTPALADFGMASWFGAALSQERLSVGDHAGTPQYTAPEQRRGEVVDARADLYSLGCILYELYAGQPPPAGRLPSLPDTTPRWLAALLPRLLARDPSERIGYAADVAQHLAAKGAGPGWGDRATRPYLYRPRLAGREGPLAALCAAVDRAGAGQGGLTLVAGESGVGKTRLASEVAAYARERQMHVLLGGADATHDLDAAPLQHLNGLLEHVADLCRAGGPERTRALLGRNAPWLAPHLPSDLPETAGLSPPPLAPDAARARLFQALSEVMTALAKSRPLVLIIDDLQWADELSLGFLAHLVRVAPARVAVIGTYRSDEAQPELAALVEAVGTPLALGRLGATEVTAVAGSMLAVRDLPEVFGRFLAGASEGSPFFVGELVRAAVREALLTRDTLGAWRFVPGDAAPAALDAMGLPASIHALIARRLSALGADGEHLAQAGAVLGRAPDHGLLAALIPGDSEAALASCLAHAVLEHTPDGGLRFTHDKIREAAYASIPEARRSALHAAAARALIARADEGAVRAAEIARHLDTSGDPVAARPWHLQAAHHALAGFALDEARRSFERYLATVSGATDESVEARVTLAEAVLKPQGETRAALDTLAAATEEARALADPALLVRTLMAWAKARLDVGELDGAGALLAEARRALSGAPVSGLAPTRLDALEAEVLFLRGHVAEAATRLEAVAQAFAAADEGRQAGRALMLVADAERRIGHIDKAFVRFEEALTALRAAGARADEAECLARYAATRQQRNELASARDLLERALAIHRETGDLFGEGRTTATLGSVAKSASELAQAEAYFVRGLALVAASGDRRSECSALIALTDLHGIQGRAEEAVRYGERAAALTEASGFAVGHCVALRSLAEAYRDAGRLDEGLRCIEEAVTTLGALKSPIFEANCLLVLATFRQQQGDLADAWRTMERSREMARAVDHPHLEVMALLEMAALARRTDADLTRAEALTEAAVAASERSNALNIGDTWVARGRLRLAEGRSAAECLAAVEAMELDPETYVGRGVVALREAQEAWEQGEPLTRGERWTELPSWLRRWHEQR